MKTSGYYLSAVALASFYGLCTPASALTLGRLQGVALLGKPLDVAVTVQMAGDSPDLSCFSAKVRMGENTTTRAQLSLSPGAAPDTQMLRVRSADRVLEPALAIEVESACGQRVVRKYVLLAEYSAESADQPVMPESRSQSAAVSEAPARASVTKDVPVSEKAADPVKAVPPVKKQFGAKLHLTPQPNVVAKNSAALDALERRVDQITQRQDTFEAADKSLQTQAKVDALAGQLDSLQKLTLKNQQNLTTLTALVDQIRTNAESSSAWVWAVGVLLILILTTLIWLILRVRSSALASAPWWSPQSANVRPSASSGPTKGNAKAGEKTSLDKTAASNRSGAGIAGASVGLAAALASSRQAAVPAAEATSVSKVDKEHAVPPSAPVASRFDRREFAHSSAAALRSVNTREMLDVRQQADFFVALGQYDRAAKVLESSISQSDGANPLVYLDLLKILHSLGLEAEFERYRSEFNQQFTGCVPEYFKFEQEGRGLEAYDALSREIAELWGSHNAIDFIELCLVRTDPEDHSQDLDLEAFRDLLLLHGVLRRLEDVQESDMMPFSASRIPNSQVTDRVGIREEVKVEGSSGEAKQDIPDTAAIALQDIGKVAMPGTATSGAPLSTHAVDLDLSEFDPPQPSGDLLEFDLSGYGPMAKPKPEK